MIIDNDDLNALFMFGYNNPDAKIPKTASQSKLMLMQLGQIFSQTSKQPPQDIFRDGDDIVNIAHNTSRSYSLVCLKTEILLIDNYGQIFCPKTSRQLSSQFTSVKPVKTAEVA